MKSVKRIVSFAVIIMLGCALTDQSRTDGRAESFIAQGQGAYIAELEKKIAGQENKPAEEVFKNIQIFKGMPASRVLRVMAIAFAPSLGVDCTHCHTPGEWERDDKEAKQTARKMWLMMPKVNSLIKETIGKGSVNCTTCHRGQAKPALNMTSGK